MHAPRGPTHWLVAFCLWVSAVAAPATASAAEHEPPKAVIWVETADDRALVERVRGQVSDLDLELLVVETHAGAVRRVPADSHAFALVWFTREDPRSDRIAVHATTTEGDPKRALVREIGGGAPTSDGALRSATLEAAALVVREALRELLANAAPAPEPPPNIATQTQPTTAHEPAAKDTQATERVNLRAELTWDMVLDGIGPRFGPGLNLGAKYRTLELSVFAAASLPKTEQDRFGAIRLRRDVLGIRAVREWRLSNPITLDVGVAAGIAFYARSVQQLQSNVNATADHVSVSALFGPELRLGWAPGSGPLELGLTAGLDVVPGAPRIGYQIDGRFEPSFVIWRLQPRFGIGLKFLSDRLP